MSDIELIKSAWKQHSREVRIIRGKHDTAMGTLEGLEGSRRYDELKAKYESEFEGGLQVERERFWGAVKPALERMHDAVEKASSMPMIAPSDEALRVVSMLAAMPDGSVTPDLYAAAARAVEDEPMAARAVEKIAQAKAPESVVLERPLGKAERARAALHDVQESCRAFAQWRGGTIAGDMRSRKPGSVVSHEAGAGLDWNAETADDRTFLRSMKQNVTLAPESFDDLAEIVDGA